MAMFLKFTGPMASYSRGKTRFDKNKIYKIMDEDLAWELLDTGRFQQVRDPTVAAAKPKRGGVRIERTAAPEPEAAPEKGDISQKDLQKGGHKSPEAQEGVEGDVEEIRSEEDKNPRLPAQQFTSKAEAIQWADENLGLKLDKSKSITTLNKQIVEAHTQMFGKADDPDEVDDDDTRDENTKVEAITVA